MKHNNYPGTSHLWERRTIQTLSLVAAGTLLSGLAACSTHESNQKIANTTPITGTPDTPGRPSSQPKSVESPTPTQPASTAEQIATALGLQLVQDNKAHQTTGAFTQVENGQLQSIDGGTLTFRVITYENNNPGVNQYERFGNLSKENPNTVSFRTPGGNTALAFTFDPRIGIGGSEAAISSRGMVVDLEIDQAPESNTTTPPVSVAEMVAAGKAVDDQYLANAAGN